MKKKTYPYVGYLLLGGGQSDSKMFKMSYEDKCCGTDKANEGDMGSWLKGGDLISCTMAREGSFVMTFEQTLDGSVGLTHASIFSKNVPGRRNSKD